MPALTGLRGVAAWWVVIYHFSEPLVGVTSAWMLAVVRQGYLAVDLFFILSGYVIYLTSMDYLQVFSLRSVLRFWLNRLIRIYPLHIFLLTLYLINPLALWAFATSDIGSGRYDWDYFIASIFLIQNWGWFSSLQWNIPAWSISAEFAAYLLCPLLISIGIVRLEGYRWRLVFGILIAAAALGVAFSITGNYSIGNDIPFLGVLRCLLEFWMGLCLGAICRDAFVASKMVLVGHSINIFFLMVVFFGLIESGLSNQWFVPLFFSGLIYLLSRGDAIFSRLLSLPLFHYLGLISYSTYLVHYFIKDWVKFLSGSIGWIQFVLYVMTCFFSSVALYRYVEEPTRRIFRQKFMVVKS